MACFFDHNWSWPRKRGERHMQVCLRCGSERESRVQFDGPRYRRTQDAVPESEQQVRSRQLAVQTQAAAA